jgi:hypothetical protein
MEELTIIKEPVEITLKWEWLQRIAEYYEFPTAMFFGNIEMLKNHPKTRTEQNKIKADRYDKIKELIEEGNY